MIFEIVGIEGFRRKIAAVYTRASHTNVRWVK